MQPPQATAQIVFEGVSLSRGGAPLFDNLHLTLGERRIGLIGGNGAGKSSLLRLINGLLQPQSGRVITAGFDTASERERLPGAAGFLFQNPDHQILFPTVGEEIAFGLRESGMDARNAAAVVESVLTQHGWQGWASRPVHELSEGQKQRLCFMAVMAMQPQVILLDEPFASLDLRARTTFMRLIARAPQQVIMATHDLDLLAGFDRAIWLDKGRIAGDGPVVDVIAAYESACANLDAETEAS